MSTGKGRVGRLFRRARAASVEHVDEPDVEDTRACPHCRGAVSRGATVCIHCEQDLVPVMSPVAFSNLLKGHTVAAEVSPKSEPSAMDDSA